MPCVPPPSSQIVTFGMDRTAGWEGSLLAGIIHHPWLAQPAAPPQSGPHSKHHAAKRRKGGLRASCLQTDASRPPPPNTRITGKDTTCPSPGPTGRPAPLSERAGLSGSALHPPSCMQPGRLALTRELTGALERGWAVLAVPHQSWCWSVVWRAPSSQQIPGRQTGAGQAGRPASSSSAIQHPCLPAFFARAG